jgi:hypothetical protein
MIVERSATSWEEDAWAAWWAEDGGATPEFAPLRTSTGGYRIEDEYRYVIT